jgi:hypothetical protein
VKRKSNIDLIEARNNLKGLKRFIEGKRSPAFRILPANIPIHFGGLSDPFQPIEAKYGLTKEALKIFAETGYPVVISTKGKLAAREDYLELLGRCNVVMQVSAVCSKYDKIEPGAPTFEERVEMCRQLSGHCKRLIVRIQPYTPEVLEDVLGNIQTFKDAGVYGVILEGMKYTKKPKNCAGLVKVAGDYCYDVDILRSDFIKIKKRCHEVGLKFFSGENRLRCMGDSMTCCGCEGLPGFEPNKFNCSYIYNKQNAETIEGQKKPLTETESSAIFSGMIQNSSSKKFAGYTFEEALLSRDIFDAIAPTVLGVGTGAIYTRDEMLEFTRWLRSTGITNGDLRRITGTDMGTHYLSQASQPAIPTAEEWEKIKKHPKIKGQKIPERINDLLRRRGQLEREKESLYKEVLSSYRKGAR